MKTKAVKGHSRDTGRPTGALAGGCGHTRRASAEPPLLRTACEGRRSWPCRLTRPGRVWCWGFTRSPPGTTQTATGGPGAGLGPADPFPGEAAHETRHGGGRRQRPRAEGDPKPPGWETALTRTRAGARPGSPSHRWPEGYGPQGTQPSPATPSRVRRRGQAAGLWAATAPVPPRRDSPRGQAGPGAPAASRPPGAPFQACP